MISIEHCSREANKTAHELARRGMQTELNCNWDDEPPSFILESLMNDVISLDNKARRVFCQKKT